MFYNNCYFNFNCYKIKNVLTYKQNTPNKTHKTHYFTAQSTQTLLPQMD